MSIFLFRYLFLCFFVFGLFSSDSRQTKLLKNSRILFQGQIRAGHNSNIRSLAQWLWIVENDQDDRDIVLKNSEPLENAHNGVTDAFCLSFCDEFYCSASNMAFFSSCLNPQIPVHILPCFEDWYGR